MLPSVPYNISILLPESDVATPIGKSPSVLVYHI
jgi:hypothetical protein